MIDNMLGPGKNAPNEVDVLIEIAQDQGPVKYEFCKDSGKLRVDRILQTSMQYPGNYGYIPGTLCDDGDPCDVLVMSPYAIMPGALVTVRPLGMLVMEDEAGLDNKVLAVPVDGTTLLYQSMTDITDVAKTLLEKIEHFFTHYKDLDSGKWVKVQGWEGLKEAQQEISESITKAQKSAD